MDRVINSRRTSYVDRHPVRSRITQQCAQYCLLPLWENPVLYLEVLRTHSPWTTTRQDDSASPSVLLALHLYLPASSDVHELISSEQTPTMYDVEYLVSAVMSRLSRYHVTYFTTFTSAMTLVPSLLIYYSCQSNYSVCCGQGTFFICEGIRFSIQTNFAADPKSATGEH